MVWAELAAQTTRPMAEPAAAAAGALGPEPEVLASAAAAAGGQEEVEEEGGGYEPACDDDGACEAAAQRIRLGCPATATDQECAAREDGMAPGELGAWCSGWRGWVDNTPNTCYGYGFAWLASSSSSSSSEDEDEDEREGASAAAAAADLAAAVRRLALAALLQDRLAEDSPAAEDGVKLLDVLPEVATKAAERAVRAVMLPLLCSLPCSSPANEGNASAHLCTGPSAKRVVVVVGGGGGGGATSATQHDSSSSHQHPRQQRQTSTAKSTRGYRPGLHNGVVSMRVLPTGRGCCAAGLGVRL